MTTLRHLISQQLVVAPGVYDGLSALLADRYDFAAVYMSGYCVSASRFGLPDASLIGLSDMVEALQVIRRCTRKPLIADADTGYGGLINVQHTVRSYEAAGASALQIEDQELPKKCGHTKGKRVISTAEMVAKVEVAIEARKGDELLIIARTDSLASEGFEAALDRCHAYKRAGADIVFIDAIDTIDQMERFAGEFPRTSMVNIVPYRHFVTPQVSPARLDAMGFGIAIFPGVTAFPAIGAMEKSFTNLLNGDPADPVVSEISPHELVGFPRIWEDEARWQSKFSTVA